ncbi:response regulator [Pedobacter glucosidilyticus]|uniref:response regulator n=1 Tax=Pedobacter glucosidilyticus TaxID=1122941 RepID=UPI00041C53CF|nr:response regulator [Pedobacter glucosidilyticus]
MKLNFIIVDDRELDCFIAEKLILNTGKCNSFKAYDNAIEALQDIKAIEPEKGSLTVLLLDIMMPVMNGFQFIEEFENLPKETKNNYRIISITTSLNKNDISRISTYESVFGVLKKPYSFEAFEEMINNISQES